MQYCKLSFGTRDAKNTSAKSHFSLYSTIEQLDTLLTDIDAGKRQELNNKFLVTIIR